MKNRNRKVARLLALANDPQTQTGRPECIHLGDVLPQQSGPCGQRLRRCDVFERCTLLRCDAASHACADCERYESDASTA